MNFKAIVAIGIVTLGGTTLTLINRSAQAHPQLTPNSPGVVKDVILWTKGINEGVPFKSNSAIRDLSKVGFDNKASAIAVNNGQKWRFYKDKNFQGEFIEIGPDEARSNLGKFNNQISSFKSVK